MLDAKEVSVSQDAGLVLVVDDEEGVRELVSEAVEAVGHSVIAAKNGKEALLSMERHRFDLVITDLSMPEMGGEELVGRLRGTVDTPILLISGDQGGGLSPELLESVDAFLPKPFPVTELMDTVTRLCAPRAAVKQPLPC